MSLLQEVLCRLFPDSIAVFTGVLAISTICYTVYSAKQWRTTRNSLELARFAAFMHYMPLLAKEIDTLRSTNPQKAEYFELCTMRINILLIDHVLGDFDFKKDSQVREYFSELDKQYCAYNIESQNLMWLGPILEKIKQ